MKSERSSFGFALVGLAFGAGTASSMISKATIGPSASSASQGAWVQLPEPADDGLRPELQRRRTAGMQERRTAGDDLDRVRAHAERGENRHRVALGVEDVDERAAAPMPAFAVGLGPAAPHGRSRDALVVFARSEKYLPDFEQRNVAQGPARVALGGGDEARNEARAHVGKVGRDRIGERERSARRRRTVPPPTWRRTTRSPPRAMRVRPSVRLASRGALLQ